jgi:pyruvate/2-oxoglutarate/acetoin dehydrogenase E1 component
MAEADLDGVIRSIAKTQHKVLMDAARKRQGRLMELAAKAKDKAAKAQFKQTAKDTLLLAGAAARRMQIAAENAADSYARAVKRAAEDLKQTAEAEKAKLAEQAARKAAKAPAKKPAKKAAKKKA